ncbi:unnamed protein product [[Candida] boidinii]|nr:unnamed protein product [[Candida] boidinii]
MKNPANVFTGLSFFNVLASQSLIMPLAISTCIDGYIGLRRTQAFLLSSEENDELNDDDEEGDTEGDTEEERDSNSFTDKKSTGNSNKEYIDKDQNSIAIQVVNGTFEWDKLSDEEENEKKIKKMMRKRVRRKSFSREIIVIIIRKLKGMKLKMKLLK